MITYILILSIYKGGLAGIEFSDRAACEAALKAARSFKSAYVEVAVCVPKASQP